MKISHISIATALLLSMPVLLSQQTSAVASQELQTLQQVNRLSRDLAPFPDFFQEGREKFEREIQLLNQRQNASSTEDILKIHVDSQAEIDNLPQFKPNHLQQSQPQ
jgi:hypothetical protein